MQIVKEKKIYIKCQENSWCTTDLFKFWLNKIFLHYQNCIKKKNCLLIFDRATSHINSDIINYMNLNNIYYVIIPSGFTRFLQPLDLSINKPFKNALKEKYLNYQQTHINDITENKFTLKDEDIIRFIDEIWNKENIIKKDIIKKSFLYCGISQALDGSEDEYFRWPDLSYLDESKSDNEIIINDLEDEKEEKKGEEKEDEKEEKQEEEKEDDKIDNGINQIFDNNF